METIILTFSRIKRTFRRHVKQVLFASFMFFLHPKVLNEEEKARGATTICTLAPYLLAAMEDDPDKGF
jgi:hypothetical protein